jgi:DNA-binding MarR family transcriptional regulator
METATASAYAVDNARRCVSSAHRTCRSRIHARVTAGKVLYLQYVPVDTRVSNWKLWRAHLRFSAASCRVESEGWMSSAAFVKMVKAYRDTLGTAYPRQDMVAVVTVFRACAGDGTTTQDRIRQTAGLSAGNLSKVVQRACRQGWVCRTSRGTDGTKEVSLTPKGRTILDEFELACTAACSDTKQRANRPPRKKSRRSRIEEAKRHTLSFFEEQPPDEDAS